jgi:cytoskeletal protein CcmA (bactofilin family)
MPRIRTYHPKMSEASAEAPVAEAENPIPAAEGESAWSPAEGESAAAPAVEVPLGQSLAAPAAPAPAPRLAMDDALPPGQLSTLAEGLAFAGNAALTGSITVAGEFQGNIRVDEASDGHVVVTETGVVVGDVRSRDISVRGQTDGTLDAAGGKVTLHSTSSVAGKIRYTHLQVDGADLNAQLERVRAEGDPPPPQRRRRGG